VRRAFLFNLVLLVLINLLVKPFFIFGVDLAVQNRAAPGAYGLYFALLNWTYLFQIVADAGLQNYNSRHLSQHPHTYATHFPNVLKIKGLLVVAYLLLTLGVAAAVGGYAPPSLGLLGVLLVNQALVGLILLLRSSIAALGRYTTDSLLSALDKLLMLGFCGATLWWHAGLGDGSPYPIEWFAWSQALALAVTLGVVWALQPKHPITVPLPPQKSEWSQVLRRSWPFALVVLLMSAYTRLDGILLERLLPDGALHADVFAGAYRLLDAANMFGYLFASLLLPMFARMLAERTPTRPLVSLSFWVIWVGGWSLCVAVWACRADLVAVMFSEKIDLAYRAEVLGVLIWAFAATCVTYIFSTLLTADERLMAMNRFFVVGVLIDVALNFLLVPRYAAVGSAWAAVTTQSFVALSMVGLSVQTYGFRASVSGAAKWLIFTGLMPLVGCFFLQKNDLAWWAGFGGVLLAGGVLALVLRGKEVFFEIKKWQELEG
jgi:O-antigen/teichoic acid export membrane protein